MKFSQWSASFVLVMSACTGGDTHESTGSEVSGDAGANDTGSDSGSDAPDGDVDAPPASCAVSGAPGTIGAEIALPSTVSAAVLAADASGNVFYVGDGVHKLDAALAEVYAYPHGEVVAVDAQGNAYVAGSFSEPTDFGTGVIVPSDNVDVFLVKLSTSGQVLFAAQLGSCGGDGVHAIAVAADGRIAVSGAAMGTIVVDASGAPEFSLAASGYLAFDSQGRLVVAGSFNSEVDLGNGHRLSTSGDLDAFVARYDVSGNYDMNVRIGDTTLPRDIPGYGVLETPRAQVINGVAIGANDSISISGAFMYEIDLFGRIITQPPFFPSGTLAGAFVATLDASGSVVRSSFSESNAGIAIGGLALGDPEASSFFARPGTAIAASTDGVVISGNTDGNAQPPFAYPQLTGFDASGNVTINIGNSTGVVGAGRGVAFDGCGNIVWASAENAPSIFDPHLFIRKIAF